MDIIQIISDLTDMFQPIHSCLYSFQRTHLLYLLMSRSVLHLTCLALATNVCKEINKFNLLRRIMSTSAQHGSKTTACDAREIFNQAVDAVLPSQMIQKVRYL